MTHDAGRLAAAYFESWRSRDFDALSGLLADGVTFRGPLGTADDRESCLTGLRGMAEIITDIQIRRMFIDGDDVATWFDLCTSVAAPCPTVNWSHARDGRIDRIRVVFDARELAAALGR
jgi:hypothetical protein